MVGTPPDAFASGVFAHPTLLAVFAHPAPHAAIQYFGRCELAHSRACAIGARGRIARSFFVAARFSMRSRQRQKAGNFGYRSRPSGVRLNAKVLGRMKKSASVSSAPSR